MNTWIGGMFPLEKVGTENKKDFKPVNGDVRYLMSGRCAIDYCLKDSGKREPYKAYVPAYTCETVLASYEKEGYDLISYDINPEEMKPIFNDDELGSFSVMNLCGYYGFCRYDDSFISKCHNHGAVVIQDTTHSPYYIDPKVDYAAGSLRKWMGIAAGGVAIKLAGKFSIEPFPPEKEHLDGRYESLRLREEALRTGNDEYNKKASDVFWSTELRLRTMFDAYGSDEISERIIKTFDFQEMAEKRRRNYKAIISGIKAERGFKVVFPELRDEDVPSHFTVYADNRDDFRSYLSSSGVSSTVYWPRTPWSERTEGFDEKFPGAAYIYDHVVSIQLDQRYDESTMRRLAAVLSDYRG